ncbi:hypothetical protein F4779DRAFT_632181 [Xylariaceae sp. FL0662B]|nr:hypothetical protein F4779DRAFT_632181 [Xylariaceae sp. FL0662B]
MESQTGPADEDKVSQIKSIFHEIQTIYDAGTPIFTKENIRKVGEQLRRFENGERNDGGKIILKGVNGVDYEVFVNPPIRDPLAGREHLRVGGSTWMIYYSSIECLTACINTEDFDLQTAYLPMRIFAPIRRLHDRPEYKKPPAPPAEDFSTCQAIERQWKTSQHYERLQAMLSTIEIPFRLTKVIGIGLGPFILGSQISKRSVLQHALVSVLHSALVQRSILSVSSERYAQDPAFTQRDRAILNWAGLTVLDDPQALLDPDLPVRDIVADTCRPGIIIWGRGNRYSPINPRVKNMIDNEYSVIEFPYHEDFHDLITLIKKSS